ncbi:hypothetical protein H4S08_002950 [Coemansia sp. RSA 1365]|nr:hypothetical protein H4S08_002950 [Coemansia sp. RSA 1365]
MQLQSGMAGMMGREHQSRILFVSLLENYCRTYDDDPLRNRRLFFAICRTLYSMGIIGKEYVDEMSSVRATYSDAFRQLVDRAQESLDMYEQHDIETGIRSLMNSIGDDSDSVEFESSYTGEWSVSRDRSVYTNEQLDCDSDNNCPEYGRKSSSDSDASVLCATESSSGDYRAASVIGMHQGSGGDPTNEIVVPDVSRLQGNYDGTRSAGTATARGAFDEIPRLRRMSKSGPVPNTFETMMMDARRSRYHDDFVQLRCLGKGGFGKVYEVRNKLDGRPYAVKHIRIKGEITAEKTLREIKMLANLDHANIVRYYGSWIEVNHVRKRASARRHDVCSVSPPPQLTQALCGAAGSTAYAEQHSLTPLDNLTTADMMDVAADSIAGGLIRGRYIAGSSSSLASFTSSHDSVEEMQFEDAIANPFDSATGISISAASPGESINGGILLGDDSFDNGEAYVMTEVSIGHTNESYDQRQETESNIIFELSTGANARPQAPATIVESPEASVYDGANLRGRDSILEFPKSAEAVSIDSSNHRRAVVGGERRHRRLQSFHFTNNPQQAPSNGSNANRNSASVIESLTGQAQSLPSQIFPGIDAVQPMVTETTLFVQMQLCQTTLQEFLLHRNERIASSQKLAATTAQSKQATFCEKSSEDEKDTPWCEASERELLIDPVMNVRLFRAIVEGVKYFHNRGVIHRDLKGANVFLDIVYADSGGNPISRAGSGVGRPAASNALTRNHGSLPSFGMPGIANVHADAWDAIDGGNLKERPVSGDTGNKISGGKAGAFTNGRTVEWGLVFNSIIANRSVNSRMTQGPGPLSASRVEPVSERAPQWHSLKNDEEEQPPAVTFIPRIGDFGLATKSTLGVHTSGDEYAFIGNNANSRSSSSGLGPLRSDTAASTATATSETRHSPLHFPQMLRRSSLIEDLRRTSNVGTITYAAPEQLCDRATEYNEKADIYSLGIIFFELYYPFATAMERVSVIKDLRRGVFPPEFLQMWPKEAAFILQLMESDPDRRPSAKEILAFDLIDVPTLESAQLKREVHILKQQLRVANQRNEELGLRVTELERIVDMSL